MTCCWIDGASVRRATPTLETELHVSFHAEGLFLEHEDAGGVGVAVVLPVTLVGEVEEIEVNGETLGLVEQRRVEQVLRADEPLAVEVAVLASSPLRIAADPEAACEAITHAPVQDRLGKTNQRPIADGDLVAERIVGAGRRALPARALTYE